MDNILTMCSKLFECCMKVSDTIKTETTDISILHQLIEVQKVQNDIMDCIKNLQKLET